MLFGLKIERIEVYLPSLFIKFKYWENSLKLLLQSFVLTKPISLANKHQPSQQIKFEQFLIKKKIWFSIKF